jgi:hypothetical protein
VAVGQTGWNRGKENENPSVPIFAVLAVFGRKDFLINFIIFQANNFITVV